MGARERGGKTVAAPVASADGETAREFAKSNVKPGATIYTDESTIYNRLPFNHEAVSYLDASERRRDICIIWDCTGDWRQSAGVTWGATPCCKASEAPS